jgi:hypothetical protein
MQLSSWCSLPIVALQVVAEAKRLRLGGKLKERQAGRRRCNRPACARIVG